MEQEPSVGSGVVVIFFIVAILLFVCAVSCQDGKTTVIENCEYIQSWNGQGFSLTHKGNCTNAIHTYNQ
jgi:outer membrane protein assembly factor BamD (BamD/ComL family)